MQIGAQLYTAHKRLQTPEDLDAGLKKVAQIGYRSVQLSGTCPYEPEWMRDVLQKHKLTCAITHIAPARLLAETEKVVAQHEIFGCKNIGIGGIPNDLRGSLEGYEEFRRLFLPVALKMRDLGVKLHYHNHYFEFQKLGEKDVLERILEDFPEDAIEFTLDLGWAAFAGADVLKLIDTLKGRISRVHLKDYGEKPADGSVSTIAYLRPIYEGILDYDAYIKALAAAGTEYMLVEQDYCYNEDEFECLRRSYCHVTGHFPDCK